MNNEESGQYVFDMILNGGYHDIMDSYNDLVYQNAEGEARGESMKNIQDQLDVCYMIGLWDAIDRQDEGQQEQAHSILETMGVTRATAPDAVISPLAFLCMFGDEDQIKQALV